MKGYSIAFFGMPPLGVPILEELEEAGIKPDLVVCLPDMPVGRKHEMTPPDIKVWALNHGIEVLQPESLTEPSDELDVLLNSDWDLFVVASYGKILPKEILEKPRKGVLNVHPSLLPKLRGASPVRTAILTDVRDEVGVTIIKLDEEMDHGPIVAQATVELEEWPVPATALEDLLAREGGRMLAEVLPLWIKDEITPEEQDHSAATYSKKITKEDGELDLSNDPYQNLLKIRAYDGWPGTYFFAEKNSQKNSPGGDKKIRVKIVDAAFESGGLKILRVIPEGKREMDYGDFTRGI